MNIGLPDAVAAGVYADFVGLWHTNDVFVLDFAVRTQPSHARENEAGQTVMVTEAKIVARVKIPPSQVFEIMKAMEQQPSAWEIETGQRAPEEGTPE